MDRLHTDITWPDGLKYHLGETSDNGLRLKFEGTIEQVDPGRYLDPLLDEVHRKAIDEGRPFVEVDFVELAFLNSSGIKSLIKWVMKQMVLPEGERYAIRFVYASSVTWQHTSLNAIIKLSRGTIVAQIDPKAPWYLM